MGFFSTLLDFVGEVLNSAANKVDKMSDDEIGTKATNRYVNDWMKSNKSDFDFDDLSSHVDNSTKDMREFADRAHAFNDQRKNKNDD